MACQPLSTEKETFGPRRSVIPHAEKSAHLVDHVIQRVPLVASSTWLLSSSRPLYQTFAFYT
jgi:hypothetical protein